MMGASLGQSCTQHRSGPVRGWPGDRSKGVVHGTGNGAEGLTENLPTTIPVGVLVQPDKGHLDIAWIGRCRDIIAVRWNGSGTGGAAADVPETVNISLGGRDSTP